LAACAKDDLRKFVGGEDFSYFVDAGSTPVIAGWSGNVA
jgi:hypothetical protein